MLYSLRDYTIHYEDRLSGLGKILRKVFQTGRTSSSFIEAFGIEPGQAGAKKEVTLKMRSRTTFHAKVSLKLFAAKRGMLYLKYLLFRPRPEIFYS